MGSLGGPEQLKNVRLADQLAQFLLPSVSALLFSDSPSADFLEDPEGLSYAGQDAVNGVPCYVLKRTTEAQETAFYIDANSLLRRGFTKGRTGTKLEGFEWDILYRFVPNQAIPDSTYTFVPPPGAREQAVPASPTN